MLDVLLDPGRRQEAARDQARLERKFGHRLAKDPAVAKHLWGRAREQNVLSALQPDEFTRDQSLLRNQLAEGYAAQGRFAEAASATASEAHASEYRKLAWVTATIDVRHCACPEIVVLPNPKDAKGVRMRTLREIERVWTEEFGRVLIMRCSQCMVLSAFHG